MGRKKIVVYNLLNALQQDFGKSFFAWESTYIQMHSFIILLFKNVTTLTPFELCSVQADLYVNIKSY